MYKYVENNAERNHDIFNDNTPLISQILQGYWNEQIVQITSLNIDHHSSIMEKDYDGIHMIKQERGDLIFNNVTCFCHRGDKKNVLATAYKLVKRNVLDLKNVNLVRHFKKT